MMGQVFRHRRAGLANQFAAGLGLVAACAVVLSWVMS